MCGITGFVQLNNYVKVQKIMAITDQLIMGPDDYGLISFVYE